MKRRGRQALPLADAALLLPAARRTTLLRALLAAAFLGAIVLGSLLVPGGEHLQAAHAAGGRGRVVVLDVSGSVGDVQQAAVIHRALEGEMRAAGPGGHVGLVLFSDTALETLPPSAPASALGRFARFFDPKRYRMPSATGAGGFSGAPPVPWEPFIGGTAIATGLRAARRALVRAGLAGGDVVLISDLVDSPLDRDALRREIAVYARDPGLELRVRVLPATLPQTLEPFRQALGSGAVRPVSVPVAVPAAPAAPVPLWLVLAGGVVAVALLVLELLAVPLRWGSLGSTA